MHMTTVSCFDAKYPVACPSVATSHSLCLSTGLLSHCSSGLEPFVEGEGRTKEQRKTARQQNRKNKENSTRTPRGSDEGTARLPGVLVSPLCQHSPRGVFWDLCLTSDVAQTLCPNTEGCPASAPMLTQPAGTGQACALDKGNKEVHMYNAKLMRNLLQ